MKKTQFIDLISTIKKTLVSFIAIVVFIALGIAFYGGSIWSVYHTENSFTQTYKNSNMHALMVTDPFGLTEDQISELKDINGIDDAEGCNIVYRFFEINESERQQATIIQITENIDKLMNIEGQLPTSSGQTAILRSWADQNNVNIGDTIVLQEENAVDYNYLQPVHKILQWDGENLQDLNTITDTKDCLTDTNLTVTAIVDSPVYLSTNPSAHGICSENGLYIDAVFFVSKEEMPTDAFGGYTSAVLFSDDINQINSFSDEYRKKSQSLCDDVQKVIDSWDRQFVENFSESVDKLRDQLDLISIETGTSYSEGEKAYEALNQYRNEFNTKESFSSVAERDANNSFLTADMLLGVLDNTRSVLGITFLVVGMLVCYSVVSRLITDDTVQIGIRKALGFYSGEILRLYIYYVGTALLLGVILGALVGIFCIELAFKEVLASQFTFDKLPLIFDITDILPVFIIICLIIFFVTVVISKRELGQDAISLMQNKNKYKVTDRQKYIQNTILNKFKNLTTLNKTVILNLLRDRRRVFGMITGIAGASALLTAGISYYSNFTTAFYKQFQDYYCFDYVISYDASSDTASEEINRILDNHNISHAEFYSSCLILRTPDGKSNAPTVIVTDNPEELSKIMHFDTDTGEIETYKSGTWISDYYQYAFGEKVGSYLNLQTLDGKKANVPVDRYYKYHLSTPVIIMDTNTYSDVFGEKVSPNTFYIASDGQNMEQLNEELKDIDGYIYTYNMYESCLTSFSSEKLVVSAFSAIFIIMAVLIALMVIINLLEVYISEKKNEMIIMMINGYDTKFVKKYIYQDTIILTVLGILIGLIIGTVLGDKALSAVEGTSIRMIHGINWISCVLSAAITAALTSVISRISLRKVDNLHLSEISND